MFYPTALKEGAVKDRLVMLDPDGRVAAEVRVEALDSLKPEANKSVRAWAESIIAKDGLQRATKARADSWQERTVAGKPGVSFIADFEEAGEKKVSYGVCTFGAKDAVLFNLEAAAKDLEELRPLFDSIVDSYQPK